MAKFISEKEAAEMVKRHPKYLRFLVKKGTWNISYRTINKRSFHYLESDLIKILNREVHLIN